MGRSKPSRLSKPIFLTVVLTVLWTATAEAQNAAPTGIEWRGKLADGAEVRVTRSGDERLLEVWHVGRREIVRRYYIADQVKVELRDLDLDGIQEILARDAAEDGVGYLTIYQRSSGRFRPVYSSLNNTRHVEYRKTGKVVRIMTPSPDKILAYMVQNDEERGADPNPFGYVDQVGGKFVFRTAACDPAYTAELRKRVRQVGQALRRPEPPVDTRHVVGGYDTSGTSFSVLLPLVQSAERKLAGPCRTTSGFRLSR